MIESGWDYQMGTSVVLSAMLRKYLLEEALNQAVLEWDAWDTDIIPRPEDCKKSTWLEKRALEIFLAS